MGGDTHSTRADSSAQPRVGAAWPDRLGADLFATAFAHAPVLMTLSDLDDGRYLEVNEAFVRVTGYGREVAIGRTSVEIGFIHPEERARLVERLQRDGRVTDLELTLRHATGRPVFCAYSGEVIEHEGKPRVLSVASDITARKQAELALRRSEALLTKSHAIARLGWWALEGSRLTWSEETCRIFGVRPDVFGQDVGAFLAHVHPDDRDAVTAAYDHSVQAGHDGYEIEHRLVRGDTAEIRYVLERCTHERDGAGELVRSIGVVQDVTERKHRDLARETRARLLELSTRLTRTDELLPRILDEALSLVNATEAELFFVEDEQRTVRLGAHLSRAGAATPREPEPFPVAQRSPLAHCVRQRGAVQSLEEGAHHLLVPVVRARQVRAVVAVVRAEPEYSGAEVDLLEDLGSLAWETFVRLRAEEALRASEARFRYLYEQLPHGVGIYEAIEDGADFRCVDMNAAGLELMHTRREDLVGRPVFECFPGLGRMGLDTIFRQVSRTGEPVRDDLRSFEHGGQTRWVRGSTYRLPSGHVVSVFEDHTTRVNDALERERLMRAIEQAAETVIVTAPDGRIQYVNPAFEAVTGYAREEALGQNPSILKSGAHDDAFYAQMWATLTRGETWSGRIVNRRKDGRELVEEAVISPVRDQHGEIVNFVGVKRDVTEEQRLEAQLRHAQKMEAVGQLTGGVAHDFNNLLQVILGALEFASLDADPASGVQRELDTARSAGERAAALVNQLLLFSRRREPSRRPLVLEAVVRELLGMIERTLGELYTLEHRGDGDLRPVLADRGMIEQVLLNLCINARDAMPEGGRITITNEAVVLRPDDVWEPWAQPGLHQRLRVEDAGPGIADDLLEHIFEPFFTTKAPGKGTGLGLATVYGILEQHQGFVRVNSRPGEGATFDVYLPAHAEAQPEAAAHVAPAPPPGGSETILVAEDEPAVRSMTRRMLERAGYRVLTAADGEEALRIFDAQAARIDLVILDAIMPTLGGEEAAEQIRQRVPSIPVLFASGYSESELSSRPASGMYRIQKPFSRAELLATVREAIESRR